MRNNYVGDVGDYFKYGLLRYLAGGKKLGVIWYFYPDSCKNTDGLHLDYLSESKRDKFRPCDSNLYDNLNQLIQDDARSVYEVQQRDILPANTCFYDIPLSFSGQKKVTKESIISRTEYREQWLQNALDATKDCDLIFFDPDNGLETKSTAFHRDKGAKFCFYRELLPFWQRGQSLIIYQHKNLHETAEVQIQKRMNELRENLPNMDNIEAIYFPAYGGRIFFVVTQNKETTLLAAKIHEFQQHWSEHVRQY